MSKYLLVLIALVAAACGTVATPIHEVETEPEVVFDEALYERGVQVYLSSYCGTCHALDAAGTWGNFGPAHNEIAVMAVEHLNDPHYNGEATTVEGYIRESILNPLVYFVPTYEGSAHRMPAYTHLPEEDINAMVYMLSQQQP